MLKKIFNIENLLRVIAVLFSIIPLLKRLTMGRFIDDIMYKLYSNDACNYIADTARFGKVVGLCVLIFAVIAALSIILIVIVNRIRPRILNIVLIVLIVLINIFNSLYIPHHYYRIYPDGYQLCDH